MAGFGPPFLFYAYGQCVNGNRLLERFFCAFLG
jgi:hypothetical protein